MAPGVDSQRATVHGGGASKNLKFKICHVNHGHKAFKTLEVGSEAAVKAHLGHHRSDYLGACETPAVRVPECEKPLPSSYKRCETHKEDESADDRAERSRADGDDEACSDEAEENDGDDDHQRDLSHGRRSLVPVVPKGN